LLKINIVAQKLGAIEMGRIKLRQKLIQQLLFIIGYLIGKTALNIEICCISD